QCAADLLIAYNQLNTTTANYFPSNLLGNGDTLIAGVYKIFSTATLNLDLYLDAKGNPNAVFIFQIQGALSTNANSKIKLLNGALACNVFWKIEGVVDMATATYMKGTVIANNAAINMNTNDTLEGRVFSTSGAISINGINAAMPLGCGALILTGPPSPVLGTVSCYGIFSGNGTVANSGVTMVVGDIGTNVGLTLGFDSLKVTGKIHKIPDVSTALCAADLQNVYNYLNIVTPDIELLYPVQFGNNLELTPHTYLLNSATSFTGNVYLNAQGNANAVFIIKVNGAFATSTYSRVILKNGAQSKNVFWKVEGAVSIDNYSVFSGSIVCNNGAINLNTGDTLYGRALTTSGALSTAAIDAAIASGDCVPLPINWIYFDGSSVEKNVLLKWGTYSEINNNYFTIERSSNGNTFDYLTIVSAQETIDKKIKNYSFLDKQPFSIGYYRISQTDKDGKKSYYKTIQVKTNINTGISVQQFLQGGYINVQTFNAPSGNASIDLYSIEGRKMSSQKIHLTPETNVYKIVKPKQMGTYIICIESNGQKIHTGKIVIF
ncbi:MAG: ice-binding family protein, partial [Chitinophagaceae bacterium]